MRASTMIMMLMLPLGIAGTAEARTWRDPGKLQCVPISKIRDKTVENDRQLLLHGPGSRVWRNYLPTPCEGLLSANALGKLHFRPKNEGQLCRGDMVEVSSTGVIGMVSGEDPDVTRCALGGFEPITEMSVSENLRR